MKIKSVISICKQHKRIDVVEFDGVQWVGDGCALYPLHNIPTLSENQVYTMFDVPEDKRDKIIYREHDDNFLDLSDNMLNEQSIDKFSISFVYHGRTLLPFKCSQGIVFIDEQYLSPLSDIKQYEIFERTTSSGQVYIIVKAGIFITAAILPYDAVSDQFNNMVRDILHLSEITLSNKDYKKEEYNE